MAQSNRPEHHINMGYLPQLSAQPPRSGASSTGTTSPIEPPSGSSRSFPMQAANAPSSLGMATSATRLGAPSPTHEFAGRLYTKRAREIQAQEGLSPQVWGPPTSGHSTPLRGTIPESPNGESFPDFNLSMPEVLPPVQASTRRTRAGTLPSRFSAPGPLLPLPSTSLLPKTARPTPSGSPFKPTAGAASESTAFGLNKSDFLSRMRSGSMPQRPGVPPSPFGHSIFTSNWASSRDRSSTLQSIQSQPSNGPASPINSFSRDSLADTDVKTLDYLGLVDTPQPARATLQPSDIELLLEAQRNPSLSQNLANTASRIRSYSVNATENYADTDDELEAPYAGNYSGAITPSVDVQFDLQEAVRRHNLEVQRFATLASNARTRGRSQTAGVLEMPSARMRGAMGYAPAPSRLDNSLTAADLSEDAEYRLNEAVKSLQLGGKPNGNLGDDGTLEGPTRALWLGSIPASTTVSSLNVIFAPYGPIESTRVLTHKNCGFVNYENLESAIKAKMSLTGKEVFPGAGPLKIGFAKVPSATATPGHNGIFPSPSPDPHMGNHLEGNNMPANTGAGIGSQPDSADARLRTPELPDIRADIVQIVKDLGATEDEQARIDARVDATLKYNNYDNEIPAIEEPSHTRVHDAPKLREIRKRIDMIAACTPEIEEIATNMLPEIAELSSDYLGNTVVQKLFQYCSEGTKIAMLQEIAPHLAKIGCHKNGTWAAQKIGEVALQSTTLQRMYVEAIRPYSVPLFLDQFGNYVMQVCLKYGSPLNDFLFEAMLNHLWDLAQSRFSSRAMRACLESHVTTKEQQRMIAAAIALHSVQLATNQNGALLLTWFLDTCNFNKKRTVLAPRLVPHLVHLCTHKVASLTVLKVVNQKFEPEARDIVLQALFFSPNEKVLEEILLDHQYGAQLVFKVLTIPYIDDKTRKDLQQSIRKVLVRINAQPGQGYKRLMDEVGLPTRSGGSVQRDHSATRPASSRHSPAGAHAYPGVASGAFDPIALQRTGSMDSNGYEPYPMGMAGSMYVPPMAGAANQGLQYPQLYAAPRAPYYAPMSGYQTPPGMDSYRNGPGVPGFAGSPMMQQSGLAAGMAPAMGNQMYPYGSYMAQQPPPPAASQRRGRR